MAVNESIFDTAPQQSAGPSGDRVRFRSGMVRKGRPVALATFLATSDSVDALESVAEMMGGEIDDGLGSDREAGGVLTRADKLSILIPPAGIDTGFCLFVDGKLERRCNGKTITHGESEGESCPCSSLTWEERRAAGAGTCKPDILVRFVLADAPDLAECIYRSSNLNFLRSIQAAEARVQDADGDTKATLALVEVRMQNGRTFTKPQLTLHK